MTKPIIKIVNAETGEEIEREMNAQEFAQYEKDKSEADDNLLKANEAIAAKEAAQAKLVAIGLTPEDLKSLGL
jgi:hypothetical protein